MSEGPPASGDAIDAHDDELLHCYRHPDRETALRCSHCERPICVDCSVTAAVGIKCPECGRLPKGAMATVPATRVARAAGAGAAGAVVGAIVWPFVGAGFFTLIAAWLLGMGMAELVRFGAGGFRDPVVGHIAAVCAAAAIVVPLLLYVLAGGSGAARLTFGAIAAIIAAVSAFNRGT